MKVLMIGMDGVQIDTFQRGWTPFMESLVGSGQSLALEEDIMSRGWVEIFTGRHGTETGALYERPELDGSYRWTDRCSLEGIPGLGESAKPLWQALNQRGYRVGIMNVPTTNPAPPIDGFFVSGGGGGRGVQQEVGEEQCYPSCIKETLDAMGYIVDERLGSLLDEKGLYAPDSFFRRLEEKCEKRADCFLELSRTYSIDFGFIVFKSAMVMAETLIVPELSRKRRGVQHNAGLISACEHFYRRFDRIIERLVKQFSDYEVVLASDHGTDERTHDVNFNSVLDELGYQKSSLGKKGVSDGLKKLRNALPRTIVRRLKGSRQARKIVRAVTPFDPSRTRAFNITHHQSSHGIFINDEKRFGGPVKSEEKFDLCRKIAADLNEHPVVRMRGMRAFLPDIPEGVFRDAYPDLYVKLPYGYAPSHECDAFVAEVEWRDEPIDLRTIRDKGRRVSVKGRKPMAVIVGGEWLVALGNGRSDLRVIYDHVLRRFEE